MLRKEKLCGAIVYYDGTHNDARMNISIALTAARLGATVANHLRVVSIAHYSALMIYKNSSFTDIAVRAPHKQPRSPK